MPNPNSIGTPFAADAVRCESCHNRTYPEDTCSACHNCNSCCTCFVCDQCRTMHVVAEYCNRCGKCPSCCRCSVCAICEQRVGTVYAGVCSSCVVADGTTGVPFRNGSFVLHSSSFSRGEFKRNPLRRHISVELEVNKSSRSVVSTNVNRTLIKWRDPVVHDGSIGETGFEINTNPTNGDRFLNHMHEITSGLAEINAGCDDRCGMHVHINARGNPMYDKSGAILKDKRNNIVYDKKTAYNQHDLRRLTILYEHVEKAMFMLCSPLRLTSRYSAVCGPFWTEHSMDVKEFRTKLVRQMYSKASMPIAPTQAQVIRDWGNYRTYGDHLKQQKSHKYNKIRYKALNIHSYFMRGTIEFRHHEGTVDYDDIVNWSLICGYLVDKAYTLTDAQVAALIKQYNSFDCLLHLIPSSLKEYCQSKWGKFNSTEWERFDKVLSDLFDN